MKRVLALGATGTLGQPVATALAKSGWRVRVLARTAKRANRLLGASVEVIEGDSTERKSLDRAIAGCDAVHISLPTESELIAVRYVTELAMAQEFDRISYVSGTSVHEVTRLIGFFDKVGELGDPTEANTLLGVPRITLNEWIEARGEKST